MGSAPIDPKNIQGDILTGLPKKAEAFFFFDIKHIEPFRAHLLELIPLISTLDKVSSDRQKISEHRKSSSEPLPLSFINIAFSSKGLKKLGVTDDIKDDGFTAGMLKDAESLGDEGTNSNGKFDPAWLPEFKGEIDGVIVVAGNSQENVRRHLSEALAILRQSIKEVINIIGHVRPGKEDGHEHFGFEDGISNPAVDGISKELPGEGLIEPGIILLGRKGDNVASRPSWAVDGSFLAFRLLNQLVPEFNQFLSQNALKILTDLSVSGATLLGARMMGRWKSGAPIDITPLKDDPVLAADPQRNNNFQYDRASQERCPFAAHTRKMNPRSDLGEAIVDPHRIIRRGIQFGPEVSPEERAAHRTQKERGLLFVSYQSSLSQGFQFLQKSWANNTGFPPGKPQVPGFDPIIGQAGGVGVRAMTGSNPDSLETSLDLGFQNWVIPKGGEYFFSPSIAALRGTIGKKGWNAEL